MTTQGYTQIQIDTVRAKLSADGVDIKDINKCLNALSRTASPVFCKKVYLIEIAKRPELLEIPF